MNDLLNELAKIRGYLMAMNTHGGLFISNQMLNGLFEPIDTIIANHLIEMAKEAKNGEG